MVRVTRRGLSALSLILGVMVAVAVAGCSEQEQSGKPLHAPATFDPSLPGWGACSRLILEGDVIRVSSADSPGHMVTELAVDEWIKPASGPKVATIETPDIGAEGVYD